MENVDENEKNEKWYFKTLIVQGGSIEKLPGWWHGQPKYTTSKTCIICGKEPSCLEGNWLTRVEFEKLIYGPKVFFLRGLEEPVDDESFRRIMKKWKY